MTRLARVGIVVGDRRSGRAVDHRNDMTGRWAHPVGREQVEETGDGFEAPIGLRWIRGGFGHVEDDPVVQFRIGPLLGTFGRVCSAVRSEEHTSELQSLMRISYAVFCLKKKKQN